jgi:hypothetical protein
MREHRPSSAGLVFVIASLVLLPILYVLSTGPVALLVGTGALSRESFEIIYFPLVLIANYCPPIGQALERYVQLWV